MFGLGIWEIALLCIALLVFVRPEELPKVMGKLGQWYGRVTGSSRYIMRRLQEPFELDDEQAGGDGTAGSANSIADNGARPEPRRTAPGGRRRGETEPDGGDGK
ncbi:MAG: twin-arginine translocase TatA/TatE family subunit [Spirochaetaceae bacterium]|nr:twin-arginine translocase TatA/TatE family subunit [Spirochaetaceae bacterium]